MKFHLILLIICFNQFFIMVSAYASVDLKTKSVLYDGGVPVDINHKLPVDERIIIMLKKIEQQPLLESKVLIELQAGFSFFNAAEKYLILKAQAIKASANHNYERSVILLNKAKLLLIYISDSQQNSPLFSSLHLLLSENYVALEQFDLAYLEKKNYLQKYRDYSDFKRKNTIDALNQKYKIVHKKTTNLLLNNKNKIKSLQLIEVERDSNTQRNNVIILGSTLLILILFFLYQLRLRKKLITFTKTDALTGIFNRSYLFSIGRELITEHFNKNQKVSLLLLDIDHFKKINDDFGHHVGDLVLIKMVELVNETMRYRDVFARLGGEEFVALLPNTDIDIAKVTAFRIKEKITEYCFDDLGLKRTLTVSIGVANLEQITKWPDNTQHQRNLFDELLRAADVSMYQAKAQGRNSIVVYSDSIDRTKRHIS